MQSTPFRLDGLKALVTGGASGIGEATSRALAAAGASVVIVDLDAERARTLAGELSLASVQVVDITKQAEVEAALGIMSSLDILVNNAGVGFVGNIEETTLDDFKRLFAVNVEGLYLVTKALLPALIKSNGTIVNVASVAAMVGVKRRFAYSATKGAVLALTRQLAIDYVGKIRVNAVAPGTVDTPFVEAYLQKFHSHELDAARAALRARHPMGRLALPDEIAQSILYLCSREAAFVTGSVLTIDGGMTAA